jgi:hypothetical protein
MAAPDQSLKKQQIVCRPSRRAGSRRFGLEPCNRDRDAVVDSAVYNRVPKIVQIPLRKDAAENANVVW